MPINFILASQSPRRRDLIKLLGFPFTTVVANADEDSITDPDPATNALLTARLKSSLVAPKVAKSLLFPGTLILAADTTVSFCGELLNKPADEPEARYMLQQLRHSAHEVHTGVILFEPATGREWRGVSTAVVTMRSYTDAEIDAYIATGDPFDKAGAYAIQHPQFRPVAHLDGCLCNVMGLPVCDLILAVDQFLGSQVNVLRQIDLTAVAQAHLNYPCAVLKNLQN